MKTDHSQSNPKLHALYVGYAYEELRIVNDTIEELSGLSRIGASMAAGALFNWRTEMLETDTAYRDAAILHLTGKEPPTADTGEDEAQLSPMITKPRRSRRK